MTDEPLTGERRDSIIERLAHEVVKRGLAVPATLFLELHAPLHGLASHSVVFLGPLAASFFGWRRVEEARQLLATRDNVDRLVDRIEQLSQRST